jgi:hypothetical protein
MYRINKYFLIFLLVLVFHSYIMAQTSAKNANIAEE